MNDSYPKKEMDLKLKALDTKLDTRTEDIIRELERGSNTQKDAHRALYKAVDDVKTQVTFTNGKVKKITVALVAIGAFALGTGLQNISTLLKFII